MFDETTGCSIVEQLVIRGRFIDSDGKLKVKFLKILDALKPTECEENPSNELVVSLNATNIYGKVNDYIVSKNLQYSKLVGIGTDDASVMTEKNNGVVKKIVDLQLDAQADSSVSGKCEAVGVHCAAHKLSLAASQPGECNCLHKEF